MYDIRFVKNSEYIKEEVSSGRLKHVSTEVLFNEFEKLRSRRPYIFNLETTNYCNMECKMCPRTEKMGRPIQWFDKKYYPKLLDQLIPYEEDELREFFGYVMNKYNISEDEQSENAFYFHISSKCLTLHGYGEPILDPYIADLVKLCSDRRIPTYLSCVPINIDVIKIEALIAAGLTVLKFSLDALTDEDMRDIRSKHSDFSKSFEKIQNVVDIKKGRPEYKTKIICSMISLSSSLTQCKMQEEFLKIWRDKDIYAYIKTQDNRWLYEKDKDLRKVSFCTKEYCEYPWKSLTVMADGSIVPCTQDYDCEMVMGNIRDQSLEEIWNSARYEDFRKMHITGDFNPGFKCVDRCDQLLICDRLQGKPRTYRVI